jgi:hypothetical protein
MWGVTGMAYHLLTLKSLWLDVSDTLELVTSYIKMAPHSFCALWAMISVPGTPCLMSEELSTSKGPRCSFCFFLHICP